MSTSSRPKGFGKTTTGDYHRPRRPSAETIRYLRSLPLDLATALPEIRAFANDTKSLEFPSALAAALSALDEIGQEVASLAGDEHASQALEVLVRLTAPFSATAARKLVAACAGYAVFLATHRYGSHVLQTILQLAVVADEQATTSTRQNDNIWHREPFLQCSEGTIQILIPRWCPAQIVTMYHLSPVTLNILHPTPKALLVIRGNVFRDI